MDSPSAPLRIEAFEEHAAFLRRLARDLVRDEASSEDIVQQTYLAALVKRPAIEQDGVGGWLRTVCKNFALKLRRERSRRERRESVAARLEGTASAGDLVVRDSLLRSVTDAVLSLPERDREVVFLRFYENRPPREIARELGVPATTVQSRLQRALGRLRDRLNDEHRDDPLPWKGSLAVLCGLGSPDLAVASGVAASASGVAKSALVLAGLLGVTALAWFNFRGEGVSDAERGAAASQPRVELASASTIEPPIPFETSSFQDQETSPRTETSARIIGTIVDDRRLPVAGATLHLHGEFGEESTARSDERGNFELRCNPVSRSVHPVEYGLRAQFAGKAALRSLHLRSADRILDLGFIPLTHGTGTLRVKWPSDADLADLALHLRADDHHLPSYSVETLADVHLGRMKAPGSGVVADQELPAGAYALRAYSNDGRVAQASFAIAEGAVAEVALTLQPERWIDVLVVDANTGVPIEGVELEFFNRLSGSGLLSEVRCTLPSPIPPTDDDGHALVRGVGLEETILVRERRQRDLPRELRSVCVAVPRGSNAVRLVVRRPRAMRFIAEGNAPLVADGVSITVAPFAGEVPLPEVRAALSGGVLEVSSLAPEADSAVVKCGTSFLGRLSWSGRAATTGTVRWVPSREARVLVSDSRGQPVASLRIEAHPQTKTVLPLVARETSAKGEVLLTGLSPLPYRITATTLSAFGSFHHPLGAIDLREQNAELRSTLAPGVEVEVRVVIDGEPKLPPAGTILLPRALLTSIQEDPTSATMRFVAWPGADAKGFRLLVVARGVGFAELPVDLHSQKKQMLTANLVRLPTLEVELVGAGDCLVELEQEREDGSFMRSSGPTARRRVDHKTLAFDMILPGRYRLCDTKTGHRSHPFTMRGAERVHRVRFDLLGTGTIRGRVVALPSTRLEDASVEVSTADADVTRIPVGEDGSFEVRTPLQGRLVLSVAHPELGRDPAMGRVEVDATTAEVKLKLVEAPRIKARFDPAAAPAGTAIRVLGYRNGGSSLRWPEVERSVVVGSDGSVEFRALAPGDVRLWFDVPGFARTERQVELPAEGLDLGVLTPLPGGSVRAAFPSSATDPPPAFSVLVVARDGPNFQRRGKSQDGAPAIVQGLAAGRYRVFIFAEATALLFRTGSIEITSDGLSMLDVAF